MNPVSELAPIHRGASLFGTVATAAGGAGAAYVAYVENVQVAEAKAASPKVCAARDAAL